MTTYRELLAEKAELDAKLEQMRLAERDDIIADIKQKMADYEISVDEIAGHSRGRKIGSKKAAVAAKYRDPATGATWSGRGKPPAWIKGAANRDDFLI
ncbi:DNA-binding protein H-NS (plasmid) [Pararobbsia alpina]|uniref:H-NS histone family protein n=1 Tax=Pararobbsia alpina TaxID=621374 RepID=UPI0039A4E3ED